jgi:hypothetical protein
MIYKILAVLFCVTVSVSFTFEKPSVGSVIDSFNGVKVYYNGAFDKTYGRNITRSGYNLGLKYQCVEFVKRYYFEKFNHKMPNTYGHAVQFFDQTADSEIAYNKARDLFQYRNGSTEMPQVEDIVVFKTEGINIYGHIGILSKVTNDSVEMMQQNYGTKSRITYDLKKVFGRYYIDDKEVIGWLRKK